MELLGQIVRRLDKPIPLLAPCVLEHVGGEHPRQRQPQPQQQGEAAQIDLPPLPFHIHVLSLLFDYMFCFVTVRKSRFSTI